MATSIILGKVMVTLGGEHNTSTAYDRLTLVTSGGSSYISKKDVPAGVALTDTTYWQMHGAKGADGTNGNDGADGEDAYQPFKGWFDSSSALSSAYPTPQVGDFAYVKGATSTDPVAIYACATAGTWADSGNTFNPANNQEFASGQSLNTVNIVDNLNSSSPTDVLSAKQGKALDEKVAALGPKLDQIEKKVLKNESVSSTQYSMADFVSGYYFKNTTQIREGNYHLDIVVAEGEEITAKLYNESSLYSFSAALTLMDEDGVFVDIVPFSSNTTGLKDYSYTVPSGVAKIGLTTASNGNVSVTHTRRAYFIAPEQIEDLSIPTSKINYDFTPLANLNDKILSKVSFVAQSSYNKSSLVDGYYFKDSASLRQNYKHLDINVTTGQKVIAKLYNESTLYTYSQALTLMDANGNYVGNVEFTNNTSSLKEYEYVVQEGVAKIGFTSASNDGFSVVVLNQAYVIDESQIEDNSIGKDKLDFEVDSIKTHVIYAFRENGVDTEDTFYGINAILNALESITDAAYDNRYIIKVKGHFVFNDVSNHTKNINGENSDNSWWVNCYGKDYVILDGLNKDETSIEVYLDGNTTFPAWSNNSSKYYYGGNYHVIFNNAKWFECRNITFIGQDTRYCLHMENFSTAEDSYCKFSNCRFIYKYLGQASSGRQYNGNVVHGCGYRQGGQILYEDCDLISETETSMIGSHSGFLTSDRALVTPATIRYNRCNFYGRSAKLIEYSTYYTLRDKIILDGCNIQGSMTISLGIYNAVSNANLYADVVINGNKPLIVSMTNDAASKCLVVKKNSGSSCALRLDMTSSAKAIFTSSTTDTKGVLRESGLYEKDGCFYKDSANDNSGYFIGTTSMKDGVLATLLGDCSTTNKTLTFSDGEETHQVVFDEDYSSMSNSDIVDSINNSQNTLTFSIVSFGKYCLPKQNGIELLKNSGSKNVIAGMGVVRVADGFRIAKSTDVFVDGICLDDTPIGTMGRVQFGGYIAYGYNAYYKSLRGFAIKNNPNEMSTGQRFVISDVDGYFVSDSTAQRPVLMAIDAKYARFCR